MLRRLRDKAEKITEVLDLLSEESTKGTPILVEGKKDVEALRSLGIEGTILSVKTGGKSFLDVVLELEKSKTSRVILLLDFDRRGKEGTTRLKLNLEKAKIGVDIDYWRALARLAGKDAQCVEGLAAYLEKLRVKVA